ncbi:MAG: hypothetical protein M0D54_05890 [Hyphomonadaceae bacterium JAD_PAG50586_4]|nr:MAG: hypothetical protein M0D54_05890 [Hyphomonadaceae bacterium JAD_PAG50586_4]
MFRGILVGAALALMSVGPAFAQEEEIVVTATRYREAYENFSVPHVSLVRRADFAVQQITIGSDTREAAQRGAELRQALQSLTRYADRNARISVALIEEDSDEIRASARGCVRCRESDGVSAPGASAGHLVRDCHRAHPGGGRR